MDFILTYISEELIYALGWTVIHSIWQAAIIALALALLMPGLQQKTAKLRYEIAALSLFLVFVMALCTFMYMYESAIHTPEGFSYLFQEDLTIISISEASTYEWLGNSHSWAAYFNQHMPLIVSIWLIGGLFFLLRLLGGYAYIQGLKLQHNRPMSEYWQQKLEILVHQTPIRKEISLLESALIKVPMVIGYFKPIILLPIGIVNALSDDEVEAILAHELAHIHRNDYLVNIILSFIEVLFYYNPAVWWISANVRTERENCCDDIGVQLCGNPLTYAKALVSIQEMHHAAPSFAMSFSGRKGQLLQRIKRILNQPQNKSATMEKLTATCMLLLALLVITVGAGTPFEGPMVVEVQTSAMATENLPASIFEQAEAPRDTVPVKRNKQRYIKTTDRQKVEITVENNKITGLKIDGKTIPPSEIEAYSDLTEDLLGEMQELPTPPAPPAPPSPPSPTSPGAFPTPPSPPAAPKAPSSLIFRSKKTKTVTTNQNEDGNMVIVIEAEGEEEPIEIIVNEASQVIVIDGNELETGDTAIIIDEDHHFFNSSSGQFQNHFVWPEGSGEVLQLRGFTQDGGQGQNFVWADENLPLLRGYLGSNDEDLVALRAEREELLENYRQLSHENSRKLSGERQEMLEDLAEVRRQERELIKEKSLQKEQKRSMERKLRKEKIKLRQKLAEDEVRLQQEKVREMQQRYFNANYRFQGSRSSITEIITEHLLKDRLIESKEKFSFQLSNKKFKVNGKKMSKELHEKYKAIYLEHSGTKAGSSFNVQVSNN